MTLRPKPIMFCVNPKKALLWLLGDNSDIDLLDSAVWFSKIVYIARLHSKDNWYDVRDFMNRVKPNAVIFRTKQNGLLQLVKNYNGFITFVENDGSKRCIINGTGLKNAISKLNKCLTEYVVV